MDINIKKINILGIDIAVLKKREIYENINKILDSQKQHYITTPNPEIILAAQKDPEYAQILNNSDLSIPDGIGLKFAAWNFFINITRLAGSDLTKKILKIAEKKELKIGIVNFIGGLSKDEDIRKALSKNYPKLKFTIDHIQKNEKLQECKNILHFEPDILFVTLGAPYQEKFITHNLNNIPSVKLAMGVGGSFDFLTKKAIRAPKIMRIIGIEWMWRLVAQPGRIERSKRIFNAVIVFPVKFIIWRYSPLSSRTRSEAAQIRDPFRKS